MNSQKKKKDLDQPSMLIVSPKQLKFMKDHPELFPKAERSEYVCSFEQLRRKCNV